ncbi:hypothetical protein GQ600_27888 [Phytophthora cactorum]|nr:hypothetical protein GQ600_27888 [Phytophthora cactorum]
MNVEDDVAMEDSTAATRDHGDGAISIQLSERPTVVFNNDNEVIAADTTIYLRPAAKNYKSVDAISKPDVLFQASTRFKTSWKPAAPRLYFVLPQDRFTDFRYQRYLDSNRKRMTMPSYVNVRKIQQFAMEVKLVSE